LHKRDILLRSIPKTKTNMKNSLSSKKFVLPASRQVSTLAVAVALAVTGSALPGLQASVWADQYTDQINALNSQNAETRALVNDLQSQAADYQDAIAKLQAQIDGLQSAINSNVALQNDLQRQIVEAQAEIDRQRAVLAQDIKAMYVDGTPDTLEMLATSKNLSEFVDKQEYRTRVQNKIQDTMARIAELQKQLQTQKAKVEVLIKEQQAQQAQLDADRAKQQEMLSYNEGQQAAYNDQIRSNSAKISELRAAQVAANRKLGSQAVAFSGDNTYPWQNRGFNAGLDDWGMYIRQCVSYTAWKVDEAYGNMPGWGWQVKGNANEWVGNAINAGIPTGSTPKPGSVGISFVGYYGHAVWVEAVSGGQVLVSEYNYDWAGNFRRAYYPASSFTYIYFGEWNR
jgi:surface antigen